MEDKLKKQINTYIELLNKTLPNSPEDKNYYEFQAWIPNCIEFLEFSLNNENIFIEKPSFYENLISTIDLLYSCFVESSESAYIELYQRFRKIYSGAEIGESLKTILKRYQEVKSEIEDDKPERNNCVSFTDNDGNYKSIAQILNEISEQWKQMSDK